MRIRDIIYIGFCVLSFSIWSACSTTSRIPDGEQLYTGIDKVAYHVDVQPRTKRQQLIATDSAGVITSIANAVEAVDKALHGSSARNATPAELQKRDWQTLSSQERRLVAAYEKAERRQLSQTQTEIDAVLAYAPNGALFGSSKYTSPWKFGLWTYNHFVNADSWLGKWFFNTFAEAPILISNVAPQTRSKIAASVLHNHGYLRGKVDFEVLTQKNPRKAKIAYDVTPGHLFHLDSIAYLEFDATADSLLARTRKYTLLHSGDAFSAAKLSEEQLRISTLMRNNGYYFYTTGHTTFQADTVARPGTVWLHVSPASTRPEQAKKPWYIGHTYVTIRDEHESTLTGRLERPGYTYFFPGKEIPLKPGLWRRSITHSQGERYAVDDQKSTIEHLYGIGIFSSLDIDYVPTDSTATCDTLDVHVSATLGKPYNSSIEMNATLKSNEQIGPGLSYELSKTNAFRGGETVAWKIFGSYEWQLGKGRNGGNSLFNSYELGTQLSFKFPRLILPWFNPTAIGRRERIRHAIALAQARLAGLSAPLRVDKREHIIGTTTFALNADWRNRSGFFQFLTFGGNLNYKWYTNARKRHELNLLSLEYHSTINTTAKFDSITAANPALYISMRDQLLPSMSYIFTSTSPAADRHPYWVQFLIKESGNLTSALYAACGRSFTESGKHLLNAPFAQFVKLTAEGHYTRVFSPRLQLATRAFAGVAYAFGNSTRAPYGEQLYVGGANSIRAFSVRTVGPGGYYAPHSKYAYIDQTGDFKLEANAELRMRLFGSLNGAVFLDAGNVWLIRPDAQRPKSVLSLSNLRRIAVGTGMGLRYDIGFIVLRLDMGVGLHAPYPTRRSGFYNMNNFSESLAFHFAIGYPF